VSSKMLLSPTTVEPKYRKLAWVAVSVAVLVLGAATLFKMWGALEKKEIVFSESGDWGNLPHITVQTTVGILEGEAVIMKPVSGGKPLEFARVKGTPYKGQAKGPPPCRCENSGMIFDLSAVDLTSFTKLGVYFDLKMGPACGSKVPMCAKSHQHQELDIKVPKPDCPPEQCPLSLTTFKKSPAGWPNGVDFYLLKKFRGFQWLTSKEKHAHYRVSSASTGVLARPDKVSFMFKADTTSVPVMLENGLFVKLSNAVNAIGGLLSVVGACLTTVFVHRHRKVHELTLTGHSDEDNKWVELEDNATDEEEEEE